MSFTIYANVYETHQQKRDSFESLFDLICDELNEFAVFDDFSLQFVFAHAMKPCSESVFENVPTHSFFLHFCVPLFLFTSKL